MGSSQLAGSGVLQWCDRLIPDSARAQSQEEQLRQRLLVAFGALLVVLTVPWYIWLISHDFTLRPARVLTLITILLISGAPLWLRWLSTRSVAALILGLTHIGVFVNVALLSGLDGPAISALVCLPVLTCVLIGVRAAWVDAGLVILMAIGIDLFLDHFLIRSFAPLEIWPHIRLMTLAITCALSVMFVSAYVELSRSQAQRLSWLAHHDQLTGLVNRHFVVGIIRRSEDQTDSIHTSPLGNGFGLVLLDLDFFKSINDRWDHAVGDRVLVEVAQRLRAVCQPGDITSRWGGEEFLLILRDTSSQELRQFVRQLFDALATVSVAGRDGAVISVTGSVGYVFANHQLGAIDANNRWNWLVAIASAGMKRAKQSGRNRAHGFDLLRFAPAENDARLDLDQLQDTNVLETREPIVPGPRAVDHAVGQ